MCILQDWRSFRFQQIPGTTRSLIDAVRSHLGIRRLPRVIDVLRRMHWTRICLEVRLDIHLNILEFDGGTCLHSGFGRVEELSTVFVWKSRAPKGSLRPYDHLTMTVTNNKPSCVVHTITYPDDRITPCSKSAWSLEKYAGHCEPPWLTSRVHYFIVDVSSRCYHDLWTTSVGLRSTKVRLRAS